MRLDKDLRSEIDEIQSLADCAVYCTPILAVSGILGLILMIVSASPLSFDPFEDTIYATFSPWSRWFAALSLLVMARVAYRLAVSNNVVFGERIKAMFDLHIDELPMDPSLVMLKERTGKDFSDLDEGEKRMAVWRYLRWHTFEPQEKSRSINVEDRN